MGASYIGGEVKLATEKKLNFGTLTEPIEFKWDSGKIHKCVYNKDEVSRVYRDYIQNKYGLWWTSRFNLRQIFRNSMKEILEKDDPQEVLNLLTAIRLTKISGEDKTSLVDLDDDSAKIIFRNIIWNLNHNAGVNKYCKVVMEDFNGIDRMFYYMGSEFDNERLPGIATWIEEDESKKPKNKEITKKEVKRKKERSKQDEASTSV